MYSIFPDAKHGAGVPLPTRLGSIFGYSCRSIFEHHVSHLGLESNYGWYHTQIVPGAGIFTKIYRINHPVLQVTIQNMEHVI